MMLWKGSYLHDGGDVLPLLWSWVSPSWVVCTGVEDKDGKLRSTLRGRKLHQLGHRQTWGTGSVAQWSRTAYSLLTRHFRNRRLVWVGSLRLPHFSTDPKTFPAPPDTTGICLRFISSPTSRSFRKPWRSSPLFAASQ